MLKLQSCTKESDHTLKLKQCRLMLEKTQPWYQARTLLLPGYRDENIETIPPRLGKEDGLARVLGVRMSVLLHMGFQPRGAKSQSRSTIIVVLRDGSDKQLAHVPVDGFRVNNVPRQVPTLAHRTIYNTVQAWKGSRKLTRRA